MKLAVRILLIVRKNRNKILLKILRSESLTASA